jgi:aspartate carbamoyltransferase regulatory subunit
MLKVDVIDKGTVIDHIKAGMGLKVFVMLGAADAYAGRAALVMNVPSKRLGRKDIVKLEGRGVSQEAADMIALLSPGASINTIENSKVTKKYVLSAPEQKKRAGACPNPNCISNREACGAKFTKEGGKFRCHYCERLFGAEELA